MGRSGVNDQFKCGDAYLPVTEPLGVGERVQYDIEPVHGDESDRPDLDKSGQGAESGERVAAWRKRTKEIDRVM